MSNIENVVARRLRKDRRKFKGMRFKFNKLVVVPYGRREFFVKEGDIHPLSPGAIFRLRNPWSGLSSCLFFVSLSDIEETNSEIISHLFNVWEKIKPGIGCVETVDWFIQLFIKSYDKKTVESWFYKFYPEVDTNSDEYKALVLRATLCV